MAKLIQEALEDGAIEVGIEVLEEVAYKWDNYYRDLQRLAYAEISWIEKYQRKGEALNQPPEGRWIRKDTWEKLKRESQKGS